MKTTKPKKTTRTRKPFSKPKRALPNNRTCKVVDEADIEDAVQWAIWIAGKAGFKTAVSCMIGTAVCELARNLERYATKGGTIQIREVNAAGRTGVEITASDLGPGIPDLKQAMQDYYSTTKGSLGIGLSGVQRLMDEFRIKSGKGTTVTAAKWL